MPEYKVSVVGSSDEVDSNVSWKRYRTDVPLEFGDEIVVEPDQGGPDAAGSLRVRVVSVDNDALFTSKVTVEPIPEG
jgi:hypothetical protein